MPRQQRYRLPGVPQHVIAALMGPSTRGTCASLHIARGNNRQGNRKNGSDLILGRKYRHNKSLKCYPAKS